MAREYGLTTKANSDQTKENFKIKYENYFEKDQNGNIVVKYKAKINAFDIFKKLANNKSVSDLSKIYDSYFFYSKFEHFNAMYFDIANLSLDIQLKQLKKAIEIFVSHQLNLHHILFDSIPNDIFVKNQYDHSVKYFNKANNENS